MNSTNLASVWLTDWAEQQTTLQAIRSDVFIHEQRIAAHLEWDDKDHSASHFIILDQNQIPAGVARLYCSTKINPTTNLLIRQGHVGRMAVLKTHRNRGFGSLLLQSIIQHAKQTGIQELQLNAQCHALDFYARQGFSAQGQTFEEVGIMHQSMRLLLDQSEQCEGVPK